MPSDLIFAVASSGLLAEKTGPQAEHGLLQWESFLSMSLIMAITGNNSSNYKNRKIAKTATRHLAGV